MDYAYKTTPFQHQHDIFLQSRDMEAFGLFLEQGTGKSKIIVDTACWLYGQGRIDALLVVAPNGVHRNWVVNEIPAHAPDHFFVKAAWYDSQPLAADRKQLDAVLQAREGLVCVTMNVEALATKKGAEFLGRFLNGFRTLLVVDESTTIKNHRAIRTMALLKQARYAPFRRILTGTPITQGPLDLYSQINFLDEHILGCASYYGFRNRYAVLREMKAGNRKFMKVVSYINLEELTAKLAPYTARVLKKDCLDLPEKLYQKRYVELSANQRRLYAEVRKNIVVEFQGQRLTTTLALTKMLRLQQIVGGFFPDEHTPIDPENARIANLLELLEQTQGQAIIWARFRAEIKAIVKALGDEAVAYYGDVSQEDRMAAIEKFQSGQARYFVGHVQAGGKGLTLHAAETVIYFSNDFSLENRLQSEDRAHRIGLKHNVTYIDLIALKTLDETVVKALRDKKEIADIITGDEEIESWI